LLTSRAPRTGSATSSERSCTHRHMHRHMHMQAGRQIGSQAGRVARCLSHTPRTHTHTPSLPPTAPLSAHLLDVGLPSFIRQQLVCTALDTATARHLDPTQATPHHTTRHYTALHGTARRRHRLTRATAQLQRLRERAERAAGYTLRGVRGWQGTGWSRQR
jgi:hypothetical protein